VSCIHVLLRGMCSSSSFRRSIPKLVGYRASGPTRGQPFIIRIAHNANQASIDLSKNQDFVEFAKKTLDMNEDPKWYSR
jgi:hypothetical protein